MMAASIAKSRRLMAADVAGSQARLSEGVAGTASLPGASTPASSAGCGT